MKFIVEDIAKAMGLKAGDTIKAYNMILKVNRNYFLIDEEGHTYSIVNLIGQDFEIVKQKKVGGLICEDVDCKSCPLSGCCSASLSKSLFNNLEVWYKDRHDKEIYDILKARLDKEVEDE